VRVAKQAHVRDDLELEPEHTLDAVVTWARLARRLVRGGLEVTVAQATSPARQYPLSAVGVEVGEELVRLVIVDQRADRDRHHEWRRPSSGHLALAARLTIVSVLKPSVTVVDQGVPSRRCLKDHRATDTTVAAIRPTL